MLVYHRNSPFHLMTLSNGTMVILHWMVPSSSIHGQFPMPSQKESWVHGGANLVIQPSLPQLGTNLVAGYDPAIQDRFANLLNNDEDFQAQCQTLLSGDTIQINIDSDTPIEHALFVAMFFPLRNMADGVQDPKTVKRTTVDTDVLCRVSDKRGKGKGSTPLDFLYVLIGVQSQSSRGSTTASVCIPNLEIQSEFCQWILAVKDTAGNRSS